VNLISWRWYSSHPKKIHRRSEAERERKDPDMAPQIPVKLEPSALRFSNESSFKATMISYCRLAQRIMSVLELQLEYIKVRKECFIACTSSRTPFTAGVAFRLAALGVFVRDWSVQGQPPATASPSGRRLVLPT